MHYPVYILGAEECVSHLLDFLEKMGYEKETVAKISEYTIARAIDDVFLVDCMPAFDAEMEKLALAIRQNLVRREGEQQYTMDKDVGTLLHKVSSSDLPFECTVKLHGNTLLLLNREKIGEVPSGLVPV